MVDDIYTRSWHTADGTQFRLGEVFDETIINSMKSPEDCRGIVGMGATTRRGTVPIAHRSKGALMLAELPLSFFTIRQAIIDGVGVKGSILIAALDAQNVSDLEGIYGDGRGVMNIEANPPEGLRPPDDRPQKVQMDIQTKTSRFGSAKCLGNNLQELADVEAQRTQQTDVPDRGAFVMALDNVFGELYFDDILQFSKDNKSFMTLLLTEVEDPTQYGTVRLDENERVTGMAEKGIIPNLSPEDAQALNDQLKRSKKATEGDFECLIGERVKVTEAMSRQLGVEAGQEITLQDEHIYSLDYTEMKGEVFLSSKQLIKLGYSKVNCGLYYMAPGSRHILNSREFRDHMDLDNVEQGSKSDIGGHLIPWLVNEGFPVHGYTLQEHSPISMERHNEVMWRDAGNPEQLLRTMEDIVNEKVVQYEIPGRINIPGKAESGLFLIPGTTAASQLARERIIEQITKGEINVDTSKGNIVIGPNVQIANGTTITGSTYIGGGAKIGMAEDNRGPVNNRSVIHNSLIEPHAEVGAIDDIYKPENCIEISQSIVGHNGKIYGGESWEARTVLKSLEVEGPVGKIQDPTAVGYGVSIGRSCHFAGCMFAPKLSILPSTRLKGARLDPDIVPTLVSGDPDVVGMVQAVNARTGTNMDWANSRLTLFQRRARDAALNNKPELMHAALIKGAEVISDMHGPGREINVAERKHRLHRDAMIKLHGIVDRIESDPTLGADEHHFVNVEASNLGFAHQLNTFDHTEPTSRKLVKYMTAAGMLLNEDERRSATELLNKAGQIVGTCNDQHARLLFHKMEPVLQEELKWSKALKAIERNEPPDPPTRERLSAQVDTISEGVGRSQLDGLLRQQAQENLAQRLDTQQKRLTQS